MINVDIIKAEREAVIQNIAALEQNIGKLQQEIQQQTQNLIASKGAVLAFDRLLEQASKAEGAA